MAHTHTCTLDPLPNQKWHGRKKDRHIILGISANPSALHLPRGPGKYADQKPCVAGYGGALSLFENEQSEEDDEEEENAEDLKDQIPVATDPIQVRNQLALPPFHVFQGHLNVIIDPHH